MKTFLFTCLILLQLTFSFGQEVKRLDRFKKQIDSTLEAGQINGMQLVVVNKDSVLLNMTYGNRAMIAEPISDESLFAIASITKSFTALAILILVEEGKLSLEDNLRDIAPELSYTNSWESTHPLKVVHLLEHTSGWRKETMPDFIRAAKDNKHKDHLAFVNESKVASVCQYPPGSYYAYSNLGYSAAGYIVEKISGMPYSQFVQSRILRPLDMGQTSFKNTGKEFLQNFAFHLEGADENIQFHSQSAVGLITTAHDMVKYLRFHLNPSAVDSSLIPVAQNLKRLYSGRSSKVAREIDGYQYGMGFFPIETDRYTLLFHSGSTPGLASQMAILPDEDWAFFFSLNSEQNGTRESLSDLIVDYFLKGSAQNNRLQRDRLNTSDFAGYYRLLNSQYPFLDVFTNLLEVYQIKKENEGLYYQSVLGGEKYPIYQEDNTLPFFYTSSNIKKFISFHTDVNGRQAMQISNTSGKYLKTSAIAVWSKIGLFFLCLLFMVSVPIVTFFRWIYFKWKRKKVQKSKVFLTGNLALFCIVLPGILFQQFAPDPSGSLIVFWESLKIFDFSTVAVSICILTMLFGLFGLSCFLFCIYEWRKWKSLWLKLYVVIVSLVFLISTAYLYIYDFIGFTTWK